MAQPITHNEEEITTTQNGDTAETIRQRTTANADRVARDTTSAVRTPTGESVIRRQVTRPTAEAAAAETQQRTVFYAYQIIWYVYGFIAVALAFRFGLKLLGANPGAGFTQFVYNLTAPLVAPFTNILPAVTTRGAATTSVFEWASVIAVIVYGVIAWGLTKLFNLSRPVDSSDIRHALNVT